jgi:CPA1 family monovalent cation:H+ antiporter
MEALTVVLQLLVVAAAAGLASRRLNVHYNIVLVLAGVGLGATGLLPAVRLDPTVILHVFLPILIFEAAIATDLGRLRRDLPPVLVLAVPGILIIVAVSGTVFHYGLGLGWTVALLLGAVLSATDTISTLSTFRKVRVPARLTTIVENESIFNDGTALVAYATILGILTEGKFRAVATGLQLLWVVGAGLVVGLAVGWIASQLLKRIEEHLMEIMVTVLVSYGSWLLAGGVQASSVIAVVTAGITVGTVGWPGLTPAGKVAIRSVWEVAAFGVNSMVFLIIGLQMRPAALWAAWPAIAWGIVAVMTGRALAVYGGLGLVRLAGGRATPWSWQHLLAWANLKGSLAMILALGLPEDVPNRSLLVIVAFGCAIVTLTGLGLTLGPLARALGLSAPGEGELQVQEHQGRLLAARAAQAEVDRLQQLGLLPVGVFQRLRASYQGSVARSERQLRELLAAHPGEERAQLQWVRRHLLTVEKGALQGAVTSGILGEPVAAGLAEEVDRALSELDRVDGRE